MCCCFRTHLNTSTSNVASIVSNYSTFRDLMHRSVENDGLSGASADAIFCSFQPLTQEDNIYLGFKRIPDSDQLTHVDLLAYIKPGNAAIILKTTPESQSSLGMVSAGEGHYTCAWKESEEEDAYYYFDSKYGVVHFCDSRAMNDLDYQKANQKRVLFIFCLPLQPTQRRAAIERARANLMTRLNGILKHCLCLQLDDIDLFAHLK